MRKVSNLVGLFALIMAVVIAGGCSGGGGGEENAIVAPGAESKKNLEVGDDSKVKSTPSTSTE